MIFHYRAGGDFAENGVPAERMAEIDARYADALLGLLLQRGDPALDRDRPPSERAVGCCRDATVLFLALARAKGMPRALRAARAGTSDPARHVVTPDLDIPATRGWPEIAHHVVHDLAALNKAEMLLWDSWGLLDDAWAGPSPWTGPSPKDTKNTDEISVLMDEISAVTANPAATPETLGLSALRYQG